MTNAVLGLTVHSEQAAAAAVDLDKLTASAGRAEASTQRLAASSRAADTATGQLAQALASESAALGAIERAAGLAAAATGRVGSAANAASLSMGAGSMNVANLAAQFQDVAVTSAMAMHPLQIALQQGTQISAVLGPMGASGALKALGTAFMSVISPVSLVTIGLVGLVAAGLQMVDWAWVAESALNAVADVLVPIAPYAAAAAAGLALFYSPAIIGGIATVTMALVGLARQAVITGAALVAANPVGALALGFAAAVTAAVIFRDELARILGRDIVQDAHNAVNWIIGAFVGGFETIRATWAILPAVIGDVVVQAAQAAVNGVTEMINNSRAQIIQFLTWVGSVATVIPGVGPSATGVAGLLANTGPLTAPAIPNPNAGVAALAGSIGSNAMNDAMSVDYLGQGIDLIQRSASGAADALRNLASGIGESGEASDKAAKEAKRQAEAYQDLTRSAEQFIAGQQLAAQTLGMSREAANRLRYEQDMLNKAANDNIALTAAQRQEIAGLAAEMAATEEATRRLTEIYNLGKETFSGFFSDIKSGLQEGKTFWETFGNAAVNALDKIADRALSMAANGIFDMIFGSLMGGFGGGGTMGAFGRSASTPLGYGGTNGIYLGSFASGGSGVIPGSGPTDSVLAMARVTPGEAYAFGPAAERGGTGASSGAEGGVSVVRIELGDGLKAEIRQEARGIAIQAVQANEKNRKSYWKDGGNPI